MKRIGNLGQRFLFVAIVSFIAFAALPAAASANNSEAAKSCQDGGYVDWTDADGNAFRNTGECVNFVARGGTLQPVAPAPYIVIHDITDAVYCIYEVAAFHFPPDSYYVKWTGPTSWWSTTYFPDYGDGSNGIIRRGTSLLDGNAYTVTVSVYNLANTSELLATDSLVIQC